MARGRTYTRQFKLQCCRQVATGQRRPAQVCREPYLSESVLLRWRKEYDARGEEAAFTEKQLSQTEALEKRIAELERFCGKLAIDYPDRGATRVTMLSYQLHSLAIA